MLSAFGVQAALAPSLADIEARMIYDSSTDINILLKADMVKRDSRFEQAVKRDYVDYLVKGVSGTADYVRALVFFVAYGTPSTKRLGYKERSGVVNSYKTTFNKIPLSKGDWTDVVRIANGSRPKATSAQAEQTAKTTFRKLYNREPIYKGDEVAVYIIAYGVRPLKQDSTKEKSALVKFKKIYGFAPVNGTHWDILRAIAYSNVK